MNSPTQQLMVPSNTGLPVPVLADSPDVPRDMLALATALDNVTVPLFATTAARDAAVTAGANFGMCFVGASINAATLYRKVAGVWTDVTLIGPRGRLAGAQAAAADVTSAGANLMNTTFTLPTARRIRIMINLQYQQISAASTANSATIYVNGVPYTRLVIGPAAVSEFQIRSGFAMLPCPSGLNTTYLSCLTTGAGAMRVTGGGQTFLEVEDIGP